MILLKPTRRQFIGGMAACMASAALPKNVLALASAPTDKRFLLLILRGGMDGLYAVAPYGDVAYAPSRGGLAVAVKDENLIDLDGFFALHASLAPWGELYRNKEMAVVHAVASPYRERSHFDAQDVLENGSDTPHLLSSGWLNRALATLGNSGRLGIALGDTIPLVMRGEAMVNAWAPSRLPQADQDFMARVQHMYAHDELLAQTIQVAMENADVQGNMPGAERGKQEQLEILKAAASFLRQPNGARIATLDVGGWDTHTGQALRLRTVLKQLADGVMMFREEMGPVWKDTIVVAATEFGRTVAMNGSGGSDHGTGGAAFILGGGIEGGRVITQWPGLSGSMLYQNRDLLPTTDMRALFKAVLTQHIGLAQNDVDRLVFPNSDSVRALDI